MKVASVVWSRRATVDLDGIDEWIGSDDPQAAEKTIDRLRRAVERLGQFPRMGKPAASVRRPNLRELVVAPYRIFYRVRGRTVFIVHLWHGRHHTSSRAK